MDQIGDAAQLVLGVVPGLAALRLRVDFEGGEAVAEAGEGDGVIVLGEDEIAIAGIVDRRFVVDVGIGAGEPDLRLVRGAAGIDGDELLVQMIEPCLSGYDRHPLHVGCVHSPE